MTHSKAPAIDVSKSPLEPMGLGVSSTKDNKGLLSDLPPLGHMTSLGKKVKSLIQFNYPSFQIFYEPYMHIPMINNIWYLYI